MKVLYFDHHSSASEFLRLAPLDYITSSNISITRSTEHSISYGTLNPYDVIILDRPSSEEHLRIIRMAKDMQKTVIIDYDDHLLAIDELNPMYGTYTQQRGTIIDCVKFSDEVWVTTSEIKFELAKYNANIHIIPNAFNDFIYKNKKPFEHSNKVLYRGGHSHIGDMYAPGITERIIEMVNGNPKTSFYFLGQRFEFMEMRAIKGNYFRNDGASVVQFYQLMKNVGASIFFYPLANTKFNKGKSNCSLIEATFAGCAFFGCKYLPEFNLDCIISLEQLFLNTAYYFNNEENVIGRHHDMAWEYINKSLLLSEVNLMRKERLEKYIK